MLKLLRSMSKTCKGGENCCSRDFPCAEVKRLLKSECKDVHSVCFIRIIVMNTQGEGDCDRDDQCNSGLICVPER